MSVSFLTRNDAPEIAYIKEDPDTAGDKPCVLFLTGLASDMMGTKAQFLSGVCATLNIPYVRFDFRGHGQSGGRFEEGTIGLWLSDALYVLDTLIPKGPVILVGSSMGGWVSLLAALRRKNRVKGLIGLAAAPDFTGDIERDMTQKQKDDLARDGYFYLPSDYGGDGYKITKHLLDDGAAHGLLHGVMDIECPVRLVQGMKDTDVLPHTAQKIYDVLKTQDKKIIWREEGDHRLSSPQDLAVLERALRELI